MTQEDLIIRNKRYAISGWVKQIGGVVNNATWLVMIDALDAIKTHPRYKQRVKLNFKTALQKFKEYEAVLQCDEHKGLFNLEELIPEARKKYGDITNQEYYEYWCAVGGPAYMLSKDKMKAITDALTTHLSTEGYSHTDILAKLLLASACMEHAILCVDGIIEAGCRDVQLSVSEGMKFYSVLSLRPVHAAWQKAVFTLEPTLGDMTVPEHVYRHYDGLGELWRSEQFVIACIRKASEDYEEIFRNKTELRKLKSELHRWKKSIKEESK